MSPALKSIAHGDPSQETYEIANLVIDLRKYQTKLNDHEVDLTYQEFELLCFLVADIDRVLPYDAISLELWGMGGHAVSRRLNVMVHRLRTKLHELRDFEIKTVRGRGYGLVHL